jgi:hypothetical protein
MVSAPQEQEALQVFETLEAKPFEACEAAWRTSLRWLRLSLTYVPAIEKVLSQGRWREAPNPVAYIRKAATREAFKMGILGLTGLTGRDSSHELVVSDLTLNDRNGKTVPHDEAIDMFNYDPSGEYRNNDSEISPVWGVSDSLIAESGSREIDWDQVAKLAGLDQGEKLVIEVRLLGLGREQALQLCHTEEDRRTLQAAWKRFERHQGALKATLLSGEPHRARRIPKPNPEVPIELVLVQTRSGTKISFQKLVPQVPIRRHIENREQE